MRSGVIVMCLLAEPGRADDAARPGYRELCIFSGVGIANRGRNLERLAHKIALGINVEEDVAEDQDECNKGKICGHSLLLLENAGEDCKEKEGRHEER